VYGRLRHSGERRRQAEWRARQRVNAERLAELEAQGAGAKILVSETFVRVLGKLGSDSVHERATAAAFVTKEMRKAGFTWRDVFAVKRRR
jgi:hypothetical protein